MDAFFGTWELQKKVNFDAYMKAGNFLELNDDAVKPTETVREDGEYVVWTIKNTHFTRDVRFKLDEPFFDDTKDGRVCHTVISIKGDQMVQMQNWDRKSSTIVREIKGRNMIATMTCDGVEGVRIYEKI